MEKLILTLLMIIIVVSIAETTFSGDINPHIRMACEWRQSVIDIATELGSQEVNELISQVEERLIVGKALIGVIELMEQKNASDWVLIIPILEEKELWENWKNLFLFSPVQFVSVTRSIMIDGSANFSHIGMALTTLREYYRAAHSSEEGCEWRAQAFLNKCMSFLGGKAYNKLVYAQARRMTNEIARQSYCDLGYFIPKPVKHGKKLERIFGKPFSKEEDYFFQMNLWIHALFIMIDSDPEVGDASDQKSKLIEILKYYERGGSVGWH